MHLKLGVMVNFVAHSTVTNKQHKTVAVILVLARKKGKVNDMATAAAGNHVSLQPKTFVAFRMTLVLKQSKTMFCTIKDYLHKQLIISTFLRSTFYDKI